MAMVPSGSPVHSPKPSQEDIQNCSVLYQEKTCIQPIACNTSELILRLDFGGRGVLPENSLRTILSFLSSELRSV